MSHYVIKRVFFDRNKWGKDDLKDEYWSGWDVGANCGDDGYRWGHRDSAKVFTYLQLFGEDHGLCMPICEGCDVIVLSVSLTIHTKPGAVLI
jgi:hypothetical protein